MKDFCIKLSFQEQKENFIDILTNWHKLKHLDATENNLEALLKKANKVDSKVGDNIKHLIEKDFKKFILTKN